MFPKAEAIQSLERQNYCPSMTGTSFACLGIELMYSYNSCNAYTLNTKIRYTYHSLSYQHPD